jgi:hypothetical protein
MRKQIHNERVDKLLHKPGQEPRTKGEAIRMRRIWEFHSGDFDSETAERIRQRIWRIKRSKGMSLKDLSIETGYSGPNLSRLFDGYRKLSAAHVEKLSPALKVSTPTLNTLTEDYELTYYRRVTPEENQQLEKMLLE